MDHVPVSSSFVRMRQTIHLEDINVNKMTNESHIRLGNVLKFMDICACLSIENLSKTSCVTASMDHLVFSNECVMAGEAMSIEASVIRCFNSSAEVVCRVVIDPAMSLHSGQSEDVRCLAHAFFVFVRLDRGKMPPVFPETKAEIQAFELAMERRKARQYKHVDISPSSSEGKATAIEGEMTVTAVEKLFPSVSADSSLLQFTHIVLPPHANHMGNTFGGQILQWAEESAVMSATMHINESRKGNNNIFHYFDSSKYVNRAKTFEDSGLTAITTNPLFLLSTVYVNGMSFLRPSSVGDRISFRSQVCRTFGSVIDVEVIVTASDVSQGSIRHINTGYFAISCKEAASGSDIFMSPILATTVEQKTRYTMSLKRMMLASIRSSSTTTALENPMIRNEFSSQSNFIQLSSMLQMQETSIWNSELPSSLTLSPEFEMECAAEFALQDISSLVATLGGSDSWDRIPVEVHGTVLHTKQRGRGDNIILVKFTVDIAASLDDVAAYILDLSRRGEWDTILPTCRVVKNLVENEIDIVYMATYASEEKMGVDYCLLRCHRTLEDGRVVVASRSIVYDGDGDSDCDAAGELSTQSSPSLYKRGELLPSGFVLTDASQPPAAPTPKGTGPMNWLKSRMRTSAGVPGSSTTTSSLSSPPPARVGVQMEYLLQLDQTSADMLSGDFKGHSNMILSSVSRLKDALEKQNITS